MPNMKGLPGVGLCSGFGQWYSPNNKKHPMQYAKVSLPKIQYMMANPPCVEKSDAQWVIFSTFPSRVHAEQREHGSFYALWADIDDTDNMTFDGIVDKTNGCLIDFFAYTSKSANKDRPKARIIIPLSGPVIGTKFVILQKILNDRLAIEGIIPDRATERSGQVCYLPNKGKLYRHHIEIYSGPMDPNAWDEYVEIEEKKIALDVKKAEKAMEFARVKAQKRIKSGCTSPIDAYNNAYDLRTVLAKYGYIQRGVRFLSPNSESGSAGVSIMGDGEKWVSTHSSDEMIGRKTVNGTMGSPFDLFIYYEHGGNRNNAIKSASRMFNLGSIS